MIRVWLFYVISLPARTSILAAANPVGGHYDQSKTVSENLRYDMTKRHLHKLSQGVQSPKFLYFPFLPPANEVWGKVICLHLSVILSTGGVWSPGGAAWSWGVWSPGGCLVETPPPGRLLLRAVRILLECILVQKTIHTCPCCTLWVFSWDETFHSPSTSGQPSLWT